MVGVKRGVLLLVITFFGNGTTCDVLLLSVLEFISSHVLLEV